MPELPDIEGFCRSLPHRRPDDAVTSARATGLSSCKVQAERMY